MIEMLMGKKVYTPRPSKIICLLKSYAGHAREMMGQVPDSIQFFLKPPSALLGNRGTIIIPDGTTEVHHEVELSFIIGKGGKRIARENAMDHIMGYMVMMDITARDIQREAKAKGLPWSRAKGYDTFAPVGPVLVPPEEFDWRSRSIWLDVNGERRQEGFTDQLIWPVDEIVATLSEYMTLEEGDIIMTGTPEGVGPLRGGDQVRAGIDGLGEIDVGVEEESALTDNNR